MIIANRFYLKKEIGRGASGKVYLAKDQLNNSQCVLKIFKDEDEYQMENDVYLNLIQQKEEAYQQLYIDSGVADEFSYYIALKMLGSSLKQELKSMKQKLQLSQIIQLGQKLYKHDEA
ncbi:isoform 2 of casein kinase i isoform delta [Stylonychia lemnae]|uniref:Isoform 2 of casein kinase i isoform delta n=1 Tax=Stylonychia lemnae TaxID=5949 RepID=A0A078B3C9_STYLE|nr:isoform 2 of casein kinase i isoform delta [Stylonychia lemnae]|eukprot:CDW87742.1 isoform 2 of casein kinase i isoform delta [Stylonychia lemnae]